MNRKKEKKCNCVAINPSHFGSRTFFSNAKTPCLVVQKTDKV